jgi:hypothetical protein
MDLYMFYVGGICGNSNVELHDVRFSIGDTLESCFDDLKHQWWGNQEELFHIDCWGVVEQIDGFDVEVTTDSFDQENRLFFANLGGYDPSEFTELHRNVLVVARDADAAKARALTLITDWKLPHKDNLYEVEHMLDVSAAADEYGYRLRLTAAEAEKPFAFSTDYIMLSPTPAP